MIFKMKRRRSDHDFTQRYKLLTMNGGGGEGESTLSFFCVFLTSFLITYILIGRKYKREGGSIWHLGRRGGGSLSHYVTFSLDGKQKSAFVTNVFQQCSQSPISFHGHNNNNKQKGEETFLCYTFCFWLVFFFSTLQDFQALSKRRKGKTRKIFARAHNSKIREGRNSKFFKNKENARRRSSPASLFMEKN